MPVVALTGNFGTGKTTVLGQFRKLGAHTFNIDKFVHDILQRTEVIQRISELLGSSVLRKSPTGIILHKKRVADIIFNDPEKRKAVEDIIHPEVLKTIKETESDILKKDAGALLIFEVPLLFETGFDKYFDTTIIVYCSRRTAIERLEKKGFSRDEALGRIRAQMPITRKKKLADFLIDNNEDLQTTERKVRRTLHKIS